MLKSYLNLILQIKAQTNFLMVKSIIKTYLYVGLPTLHQLNLLI